LNTPENFTRGAAWHFEPSSVIDPVGRVIIHEDGSILRGIRPAYAEHVRSLLRIAEANNWFAHGLVLTEMTPCEVEGYPLVIEHKRVPFVTVPGEWSAMALRSAAVTLLDLAGVLARSGYGLKDAHTWNILFDGTRPVFIDFGSIAPLSEIDWSRWVREFQKYFLVPLTLFADGAQELARSLTLEQSRGVGHSLIDHDITWLTRNVAAALPGFPFDVAILDVLKQRVDDLSFPVEPGEWSSYPQPAFERGQFRTKDVLIQGILEKLQFSTAMDIGANRGLHALMCDARGATTLACDIDEACLNDLFARADASGLRLTPIYLDVAWPQGSGGAFNTIRSAQQRLQCDLVLALALVHHVSFRRRFDPGALVNCIAKFAGKAAVIEFIPSDDWHVAQWAAPPLEGYSLEGFQAALLRHFEHVTVLASDPAPRQFLICEGKRDRSRHATDHH
jgi:hypothetical protein